MSISYFLYKNKYLKINNYIMIYYTRKLYEKLFLKNIFSYNLRICINA